MPARFFRNWGRRRPALQAHLSLESLESRFLLSGNPLPYVAAPVLAITSTNTLNLANPVQVQGVLGSGATGAAGVDWYNFTLNSPSRLVLSAAPGAGNPDPVVSLYNNDPFDFSDPFDPLGHRLLAQAQATSGSATILTESLAPGTYFVAVSGAGNRAFQPFVAGSGYPGSIGPYTLQATATALGLTAADGPVVLVATPGAAQSLDHSPLVIRVDLSESLDPNTIVAGQTVRLQYSATGTFGASDPVVDVPLASVSYSDQIAELQLLPAAGLAPGTYRILLAGNQNSGPVLADLAGLDLGQDATHPTGQDYTSTFRIQASTYTFQVNGVNHTVATTSSSADSPSTARFLGNVTGVGLVQAAGTIGSDPAYNVTSVDPLLANPAAQVDLYHFQVSGAGKFAFTAEAFAGRIGSSLDPALSLFRVDAGTHQLVLVASNDNTLNTVLASDGSQPLANDAALSAGLTAGDYYVAVSGTSNVPQLDPAFGALPGMNGIFDPNSPHSGFNGFTTGDYVLNLNVEAAPAAPRVTKVAIRVDTHLTDLFGAVPGANLNAPPTIIDIQFSEPVNIQQLLYQTYQQNATTGLNAVFVTVPPTAQNPLPAVSYPRLLQYDPTTGMAQFLMLDAVPNGPYLSGQVPALHLSGAGASGITDLAGNPLVGNNPSGDYAIPFTVSDPLRAAGNPLLRQSTAANNTLASAQSLGVLFPNELHSKVVVQRLADPVASDRADYFSFSVLQDRDYTLSLQGTNLPGYTPGTATTAAIPLALWSPALGKWVTGTRLGSSGLNFQFSLAHGDYVVKIGHWLASQAPNVTYKLSLGLSNSQDNPPPLTIGPAPAIRLRVAEAPSPTTAPGNTAPPSVSPPSDGAGLLASVSPFTPSATFSPPATLSATTASPGAVPGVSTAASIVLGRASGAVAGQVGDGSTAEPTSSATTGHGTAISPLSFTSVLFSDSLLVSAEGQLLPVETVRGPVAPAPEHGTAKIAPGTTPSATAEIPALDVPVKGMPTNSALDVLFAMSSLRGSLLGGSWSADRLSDDLSGDALAGFALNLADRTFATKTQWLDLLTYLSLGASLTLGGWCTVRLKRRRPATGFARICWGGEDSTDFPE